METSLNNYKQGANMNSMTRFWVNKKRASICSLFLFSFALASMPSANAGAIIVSDFSADTASWSGAITQVDSGEYGNEYGLVNFNDGNAWTFGPEKNTDLAPGYNSFYQLFELYIDPTKGNVGDTWSAATAIYSPGIGYISNEGFKATKSADGWNVGGIEGSSSISITDAGWYTFVSDWDEWSIGNDFGMNRNSYIYDSSDLSNLLYSDIEGRKTLDSALTYQTGYLWLKGNNYGTDGNTLAIDNVVFGEPTSVPEPSTVVMFGIGLMGLVARRKAKA
jgi:hypothetical protein